MDISNVIALLCGVALFLFGMLLMGSGLKSVAGNKLEMILYKLSSTPLKGVLLGTGVTAVIQSSSATSVMVVGFVNSGMMKVRQAIGIILGAILGTSVTGYILSLSDLGDSGWLKLLSTATITGIVAVVGIYFRMFCKKRIKQHIGDILMGFAVLMTGMEAMSSAVSPLRDNEIFLNAIKSLSNPFLGILIGLVITCIIQSTSATVGILQTLAATVPISFGIAFPFILGVAIGSAVPVLLSAIGASVNGKRTAFIYLITNVIGVGVWGSIFYLLNAIIGFDNLMTMKMGMLSIAVVNTLFRLVTIVSLIPFVNLLEKIVSFIFKDNPEEIEENAEIDRLEDRFLIYPSIAIEQSNAAVCSMARKARKNLARAFALLFDYSEDRYNVIQTKESVIDKYEDKLGTYLVKLTSAELNSVQSGQVSKFLHTISDFERIGDHAVDFSNAAKEIYEKGLEFSAEARAELDILSSAVAEIVVITTDAFSKNDINLAKRVEPLEEVIDNLCDEMKIRHVRRISLGECTLDHGFVFNDLLNNFERVADHCSNIAVAMIELSHDLFDTHEYLNKIKASNFEEFKNVFREYNEKYKLAPISSENNDDSPQIKIEL